MPPPKGLKKRITAKTYRALKYIDSLRPARPIPDDRPGNIVLAHTGRVGSNVLGDMLASHRSILWDRELFTYWHGLWNGRSDPERLLRRRMGLAGRRYYGFVSGPPVPKVFGLDPAAYVDLIIELGFTHFILLRRRNVLRKVVSALVAQSGAPKHIRSNEPRVMTKVTVDLDRVYDIDGCWTWADYIKNQDAFYSSFAKNVDPSRMLELYYEDDLRDDPSFGYAKTCAFLDLAPGPTRTRYVRTNPFPLRKLIVNYDEVAARLVGTPDEWMLDD